MEFLSLLLLAVTIVVIYHVIVHLWETRKPTEWQEPTDCDNHLCYCASLAHPADKYPENRWEPVKDAKVFAYDHRQIKNIVATKAPKAAKKATKKAAKKPAKMAAMKKKAKK
jgi:hypothetical protein